jgi:hypothetical protein
VARDDETAVGPIAFGVVASGFRERLDLGRERDFRRKGCFICHAANMN